MDSFVYQPFQQVFLEAIEKSKNKSQDLIEYLSNDLTMANIIMFIRLRISSEMRQNKDDYIFYFENEEEFEQFCRNEVEPLSAQVDEIQIAVLFKIFGIPLRIY